MAYAQQTWTDTVTPADAAHMNHIEAGLVTADANASTALGRMLPTPVVNGQWVKGVGGAAVWSAIAEADLPAYSPSKIVGYPTDATKFLRGDGVWNAAPGQELAYAENAGGLACTATNLAAAQTIVTAPAFAADGSTPVLVEFFCESVTPVATPGVCQVELFDGATDIGWIASINAPAAGGGIQQLRPARRFTPSAGSHTFSLKAWNNVAGTTTFTAGGGGASTACPMFIRITRAA